MVEEVEGFRNSRDAIERTDPQEWWKSNENGMAYPRISKLAKQYLCSLYDREEIILPLVIQLRPKGPAVDELTFF